MIYRLWDKENNRWYPGIYDTITDARKSAYRRKSYEIWVCSKNERSVRADFFVLGLIMNKKYNKYGVPIYISYAHKGGTNAINSDGTLGKKLD